MKKKALIILIFSFASLFRLAAQDDYQLIWSDEFEQNGAPASENWDYQTGSHGWGNNELQNYTSSPENSSVKDGILTIRAVKNGDVWTSARLITKNKRDFLYGRIEASAKLPAGVGTWPAFWMMPAEWTYGGWPECGEIDIMEHVGYDPGVVHGTVHTGAYNHSIGTQVGKSLTIPDFSEKFHVYAVEWSESKIDFFIDNEKYFTFVNDQKSDFLTWPFDKPFYIILNIAIGGNWGGREGIDPLLNEAIMEVDYVRVYQKK